MVHTSAVVFAALAFSVAPALAAPTRQSNELAARGETELFRRHHKGHRKYDGSPPSFSSAPDAGGAMRRDVEDELDIVARDYGSMHNYARKSNELAAREETELFRRHHKGHRNYGGSSVPSSPSAPDVGGAMRRDVEDELDIVARGFTPDGRRLDSGGFPGAGGSPMRRDVGDGLDIFARDTSFDLKHDNWDFGVRHRHEDDDVDNTRRDVEDRVLFEREIDELD